MLGGSIQILERPITLAEFDAFPETNQPTEIVDGQVIVNPSPEPFHQQVVLAMAMVLQRSCGHDQRVLLSPIDWLLRSEPTLLVRQPDIAVVHADQVWGKRLTAPPVLAVEVLSPGSLERDVVTKRAEYAAAGLAHYVVIDPPAPGVIVFRLVGGELRETQRTSGDETLVVQEPFALSLRPSDLVRR
jgi:Uma2 family endonuclease